MFVFTFTAWTLTPGTGRPFGSVMRPLSVAISCANAEAQQKTASASAVSKNANREEFFIRGNPHLPSHCCFYVQSMPVRGFNCAGGSGDPSRLRASRCGRNDLRVICLADDVGVDEFSASWLFNVAQALSGDEDGIDSFQQRGVGHLQDPTALVVVVHGECAQIPNRVGHILLLAPSLESVLRRRQPATWQVERVEDQRLSLGIEDTPE